jgi:hypothetical protein
VPRKHLQRDAKRQPPSRVPPRPPGRTDNNRVHIPHQRPSKHCALPVTSLDLRLPAHMGIDTTTLGKSNCYARWPDGQWVMTAWRPTKVSHRRDPTCLRPRNRLGEPRNTRSVQWGFPPQWHPRAPQYLGTSVNPLQPRPRISRAATDAVWSPNAHAPPQVHPSRATPYRAPDTRKVRQTSNKSYKKTNKALLGAGEGPG